MLQLAIISAVLVAVIVILLKSIKGTIKTEVAALRQSSESRFMAIENRIADNESEAKGMSMNLDEINDEIFALQAVNQQRVNETKGTTMVGVTGTSQVEIPPAIPKKKSKKKKKA